MLSYLLLTYLLTELLTYSVSPGVYRENTVCTDEILITAVVSSDGCKGDTVRVSACKVFRREEPLLRQTAELNLGLC